MCNFFTCLTLVGAMILCGSATPTWRDRENNIEMDGVEGKLAEAFQPLTDAIVDASKENQPEKNPSLEGIPTDMPGVDGNTTDTAGLDDNITNMVGLEDNTSTEMAGIEANATTELPQRQKRELKFKYSISEESFPYLK